MRLGLAALCLVNTWAQRWRANSIPGKQIRLQTTPGALGTVGPEVPAADPNMHQAMGSYCYPTARRPLYLAAPEAGSVLSGWFQSPKPQDRGPASSTAGAAERRGSGRLSCGSSANLGLVTILFLPSCSTKPQFLTSHPFCTVTSPGK